MLTSFPGLGDTGAPVHGAAGPAKNSAAAKNALDGAFAALMLGATQGAPDAQSAQGAPDAQGSQDAQGSPDGKTQDLAFMAANIARLFSSLRKPVAAPDQTASGGKARASSGDTPATAAGADASTGADRSASVIVVAPELQGVPRPPLAQGPQGAQGLQDAQDAQDAQAAPVAQGAQNAPVAQGAQNAPVAQGAQNAHGTKDTQAFDVTLGAQEEPNALAVPGTPAATGAQPVSSTPAAQGLQNTIAALVSQNVPDTSAAPAAKGAQPVPSTPAAQGLQNTIAALASQGVPDTSATPAAKGAQPVTSTPAAQGLQNTIAALVSQNVPDTSAAPAARQGVPGTSVALNAQSVPLDSEAQLSKAPAVSEGSQTTRATAAAALGSSDVSTQVLGYSRPRPAALSVDGTDKNANAPKLKTAFSTIESAPFRVDRAVTAPRVIAPVSVLPHVAPAALVTAVVSLPASSEGVADSQLGSQIVQSLRMQWAQGGGEATIELNPKFLGRVQVSVTVDRGVVSASVQADTPLVREWVAAHRDELSQTLAQQGLRLDKLDIAQAPKDQTARDGARDPRHADREASRHRRDDGTLDADTFDMQDPQALTDETPRSMEPR